MSKKIIFLISGLLGLVVAASIPEAKLLLWSITFFITSFTMDFIMNSKQEHEG